MHGRSSVFCPSRSFPLGLGALRLVLRRTFNYFISSLAALFLRPWIEAESLTHLGLVLIALIGLLTAIYLIVTRDDAWGIVAFFFNRTIHKFYSMGYTVSKVDI